MSWKCISADEKRRIRQHIRTSSSLKIGTCPQTTTVKKKEKDLETSHPCFHVSFIWTAFNFLAFYYETAKIKVGFKWVCPNRQCTQPKRVLITTWTKFKWEKLSSQLSCYQRSLVSHFPAGRGICTCTNTHIHLVSPYLPFSLTNQFCKTLQVMPADIIIFHLIVFKKKKGSVTC